MRLSLNKEKGFVSIVDQSDKIYLTYSPPVVRLASNKTITLPLDLEVNSSTLSISLPDLSFPVVVAFGLALPDAKGGFNFNFAFPSFKFGAKGEVEDSSSDEEVEASGKKKFGFGLPKIGGKADKPDVEAYGKFKVRNQYIII